jgi:hypothetical protein
MRPGKIRSKGKSLYELTGMREDIERARIEILGRNRTQERKWVQRTEFEGGMPSYGEQALRVILGARRIRPYGVSHRNFTVGACAMIRRRGNMISVGHGVNMKDAPDEASVDVHAEQGILEALQPEDEVTAIAVVGEPQEDHGSGVHGRTLHPCSYRCQRLMAESTHVTPETLIVCNSADGLAVEWGTLEDFQRYHQGDHGALHHASFDTFPEILIPIEGVSFPPPMRPGEEEAWDAKVKFPIAKWAMARGLHVGRPMPTGEETFGRYKNRRD